MQHSKVKNFLIKNVWGNSGIEYYNNLEVTSKNLFSSSPYNKLTKYKDLFKNKIFLDLGCGVGSKTIKFVTFFNFKYKYAIDISEYAVVTASKRYKTINFSTGDIEHLEFEDNFFDVVATNFVMEHTLEPEKIIKEVRRVIKKNGYFVIICPNYGAPNRCSPPYTGSRIKKLIFGFLNDFNFMGKNLDWNFVTPLSKKNSKHISDYDTTVEPYLLSTIKYCKSVGFNVIDFSSVWENDIPVNFRHKIFNKLGSYGVFPFKYWGPQHYLVLQKI